jgi:pilus assembly protein TadC
VLIQSRQIGGPTGPALNASAELMMSKRRLAAAEAAQKSSVKMLLPLVLLILPAMMIIILGRPSFKSFNSCWARASDEHAEQAGRTAAPSTINSVALISKSG